ncbi:N-acyl homoserine lactonase family protein [Pseudoalteromonas denitrificans]|uniref:Metallo-beta-lactamase superfamily protein n=1 Tax=Pseudoalteromonas denitrificans DSM 6059 TaxID=1123010 RepID=A0A1I1LZ17_9GAMM|nr:N-acyl homoserine lactonase family protein [Pseudoalteromonas denitrificans]SFC78351.1 Metallo-beta-lactamase superfamily protein [Pseudoalteromonas denitrificans DSM 6059]
MKDSSNGRIKLYTMDCGIFYVSDMSALSEKGKFDGEKTTLANPCFLIRHPKGDLLWETGHKETLADLPDGIKQGVWHSKLNTKLTKQLKKLDLKPLDIDYLSLSHIHPDHSGNANLFAKSTFIINEQERLYMFENNTKTMFGKFYMALEGADTITFRDKYDVFGDDSVVTLSMPGHTPGGSVLLVRLENSENILLTGDLYIHRRGRKLQTLHKYNTDQQAIKTSRKKFETLVVKEKARVIIHHDKQDFDSLPKFPKFLD